MLPPVYFISVHRSKVHSDTVCRACRIQLIGNSNACTIRNANHGDHVARPPTFPLRPCPCLCPAPLPAVKRSKACKSFRAQAMERFSLLNDAKCVDCHIQLILIQRLLPLCINPLGAHFICLQHSQQTTAHVCMVCWTLVPVVLHHCIPECSRCHFHLV